jgi:hypothetical protein
MYVVHIKTRLKELKMSEFIKLFSEKSGKYDNVQGTLSGMTLAAMKKAKEKPKLPSFLQNLGTSGSCRPALLPVSEKRVPCYATGEIKKAVLVLPQKSKLSRASI